MFYLVWITALVVAGIFIVRFIERRRPIGPNMPHPEVMADWKAVIVNMVLFWPAATLAAPITAVIVKTTGYGFIPLSTEGWWYPVSLIGFLLIYDLYAYALHRLEHAVPFLWAMHSFHHSANALTLITGARHWWLEKVIIGSFLPVLVILFAIPPDIATIVSIIRFAPDGLAHLNVRFPMGRAVTWVNNPQWHRIHHSVQPEHHNKNFCGAFPIWDFLFGTAYVPRPDEYPETGLSPMEHVDIIDSIIWPFRRLRHRLADQSRRTYSGLPRCSRS